MTDAEMRQAASLLLLRWVDTGRIPVEWMETPRRAFLRSLFYVTLAGHPSVKAAAEDAGLRRGTVTSWMTRDRRSTGPRLADVVDAIQSPTPSGPLDEAQFEAEATDLLNRVR